MKHVYFFVGILFFTVLFQSLSAQNGVRIATSSGTADPSAMLDVVSTNKGVLFPRVCLSSLTANSSPVTNPQAGLVIYNTGACGIAATGLYFWNGSSWVFLNTGGFSAAGTTNYHAKFTASNAIGSSVVYDDGTNVGIGTSAPVGHLEIEGPSADWNETTPGLGIGSIHLDPGSGNDHYGSAITWGASDASNGDNAQAGIYIRSDGTYGTKMYFATTDAYVTGSKTRMMINHAGNVGIGTATPGEKLEINGKLKFTPDGSTMSKAPRQVSFTDQRGGCPPAHAAGSNLVGGTITLTNTSTISVNSTIIRNASGRHDLYLYVDGGNVCQWITNTGATSDWQSGFVQWTGTLSAGNHTVWAVGADANIWGCGPSWGRMDIMIFEQ